MSPALATKPKPRAPIKPEPIIVTADSINARGPTLIGTDRAAAIDAVERSIRATLSWNGKCPWAPGRDLARQDMAQDIEELRRLHGDSAVIELQARFKQNTAGAVSGEALRASRAGN